jgi:hypothetical protein
MAKFFGNIGYAEFAEDPAGSGVWLSTIVEVPSYGDVLRNSVKMESDSGVNSDLSVGNSISIVADKYSNEHFHNIRYVVWSGAFWIVTSVTVDVPRLTLRLGGVYNGTKA